MCFKSTRWVYPSDSGHFGLTSFVLAHEKEIFVATPPGRMQRGRGLNPKYEVKPGRIAQHLLDAEYKDNTGAVSVARPAAYRP